MVVVVVVCELFMNLRRAVRKTAELTRPLGLCEAIIRHHHYHHYAYFDVAAQQS